MAEVRVMSSLLASQVAAGEVIERPASVIKELIENSIDAGSKKIEIDIQKGGVAMMRVRDDGSGMSPLDAINSLKRHATSKLNTVQDLEEILTLGFRGEALPSIASVSRFLMQTCRADSVEGTEIKVDGGEVDGSRSIGHPPGTTIEVRDLFFNIPARRKFLKAESTEAAHIDHQIRLHALSTPEIGWVFRKNGKLTLDLPATDDLRVRIESMQGSESKNSLIPIPLYEFEDIKVEGAILPSNFARRGRKHQYLFLNGRPIENSVISQALKDPFKGRLENDQYPAAWLWITINPRLVDVNVHPAKKEVRFHQPHNLRIAVFEALSKALKDHSASLFLSPKIDSNRLPSKERTQPNREQPIRPLRAHSTEPQASLDPPIENHEFPKQIQQGHEQEKFDLNYEDNRLNTPQFKAIGVLAQQYIILEGDEGLVLFDPAAGYERIMYESILSHDRSVESQGLLVPILLELDTKEMELVMRHQDHFLQAGFTIEDFGGLTIQISSIPTFLKAADLRQKITELIDLIIDQHQGGRLQKLTIEAFAAKIAKGSAHQIPWNYSQTSQLLEKLFQCELPYCVPSGRPTLIQISHQELERKFGKS